ncbi:type II toxin-antitoxin system VapC family toxin [Pelagibacterium halotolerans]|uniref:type II toxin-antitoxin system VapC family toxin n=1 Tax=Pelagibacterium halotolerans TaxID=531813 RepID=UPI00384EB25E
MRHVLLDTHAWAWSLTADARLSPAATTAMEQAETVSISAISLFEIGQKVRLGKWPEMVPFLDGLIALAGEQGGRLLELSPEASLLAATLDWVHRDPFDRLIGATAITKGLVLISADTVFDSLAGGPGWPGRIW